MQNIKIFDTTLRDGEQSPGFSMNTAEKIQVARALDRLKVDVIEAGFPITSPDDFEAVRKISEVVEYAEVCALCRVTEKDIQTAFESVKNAKKPKIHTFIATSPIHREFKLKKSKEEILEMAVNGVKLAKSLVPQVVFSPEDGFRTEKEYLHQVIEAVIEAGADVINIPDTVGYATPDEFRKVIEDLYLEIILPFNQKNQTEVIISTHCQNDLGMATANSLAGILGGAREIQCTINGIGERAGNASLEEVVMAIKTRKDFYNFKTNINTKEIYPISKLITAITGVPVQPNKAIVGANAFAHESGIHQDGVLKNPETYEIMKAEDIGLGKNKLVLGKHSGRHAIKIRLGELGYDLNENDLEKFYTEFKTLADKKKEVFDQDLHLLVSQQEGSFFQEKYILENVEISCGTKNKAQSKLELKVLNQKNEYEIILENEVGDGPVDACYGAINNIIQIKNKLLEYSVNAVTSGIDAQATVNVRVEINDKIYTSSSSDTDIVVASCKAYLGIMNQV
jgi:2-isopropylmalate synthase